MATFVVDVVDDEVEGNTPENFPENGYDYEQYPASAVGHVLGIKNDRIYRVPSNVLKWNSRREKIVWNGTGSTKRIDCTSDENIVFRSAGSVVIGNIDRPTSIELNSANVLWFRSYAAGYKASYFTCNLRTSPSGAGYNVYADGFVEWSMARIKDNIQPLPLNIGKKPLLPRLYTQNGKQRLGFIVEESPPEIVVSTTNEEGKTEQGIDVMALCALQQAKIEDLEKRILALEGKIK